MGIYSVIKDILCYRPKESYEKFEISPSPPQKRTDWGDGLVSTNYDHNLNRMKVCFSVEENKDIVLREFRLNNGKRAFFIHIDGMVRSATVNEFILKPLMLKEFPEKKFSDLISDTIQINALKRGKRLSDGVSGILMGDTAVFVEDVPYVFVCETKGFDKRSVGKAENESSIKGAQEAFSESIRTNTTLIRRIVRSPDLVTEMIQIGNVNRNPCGIMYLKGLTNPDLVKEVKERIGHLDSDFLYGSGMVEQMIEDGSFRIFPNLLSTERPDAVAHHLCQGRVAVIAEGTPQVLVLPVGISNLIKSPEDSQLRWQYATLTRFTRAFAILLSALLPGFFVAIVNFHRGMIPTELLIAIAKTQENVPLPAMIEMLLLEFAFELIREAGIRVPGVIGGTIGIVGGLILGQAAVSANLISPLSIIVIAVTGISSFAITDVSFAYGIRIVRILFILLSGAFGFFGLGVGIATIVLLTFVQQNFGVGEAETGKQSFFVFSPPPWKKEHRPEQLYPGWITNQPPVSRGWILKRRKNHESK